MTARERTKKTVHDLHDKYYKGKGKKADHVPGIKVSQIKATAAVIIILMTASLAFAYTDTEIVTAIYKAEGGEKATYLYGIRSVKYDTPDEARRICFNTVRNNRVRFSNQTEYKDYLEFLASRYCPINCDNDTGTNKYWLKNVRYFLEKAK